MSADMMQLYGLPFVIVSDVEDYCGKLKASVPTGGCNATSSGSTNPFGYVTGSFLSIGAYGASDGAKLNIIPAGTTNPGLITTGAAVYFATIGTNATSFTTQAVSGTVSIDSFRSAQNLAGGYDVTFDNGERKTGHFAARYCDAYETVFANLGQQRSCSFSTGGSSSCTRACSCNSKAVSANCTFNTSGNNWTCSCSSATGGTSTCTMNSADCSTDTGTCCALVF